MGDAKTPIENRFRKAWTQIDRTETHPRKMRQIRRVPWPEFREKVIAQEPGFVTELVGNIYAGDVYILEGSYPKDFCRELIEKTFAWGQTREPSFHKVLEGSPDFHRVVNKDLAQNYSFQRVYHHYFFYRWNGDPLKIWNVIDQRWGIFKFLGGFGFDEYTRNSPKDGIVDRIHIHHYPQGAGEIETHSDPYKHQRTIMGALLNKKGVDFKTGGLYFIDQHDRRIDVDGQLDVGDSYIGFPTVLHGLDVIDQGTPVDWTLPKGRWFLGFYSLESDTIGERHTGHSVKGY